MTARRRKHSKARRNSNSKVSGTTGGNASNSNEGRGSTSIETSGASSSVANHADLNSIENGEQLADEVETIWQTFHRHPITRLSLIVLLPYGIYIAYLYIQLQKPHWVNRILPPQLHLRPAVAVTDERQVLIMGSMSSGTTQVVKSIKKIFGGKIEIGHEDSNTAWSYVRDGTVSWFYFIRYLPTSNSRGFWKKKEDPAKSIEIRTKACFDICGDGTLPSNDEHFKIIEKMGFHPIMYQEVSCCAAIVTMDGIFLTL